MSIESDLILSLAKRVGAQRLVELSNESGTATTVDTDVLTSACSDAVGDFYRIAGISPDSANKMHVSILIQGAIFFLEDYKARDGGIMTAHGKRFYAALNSLREKVYFSPVANSHLTVTQEKSGTTPDMTPSKVTRTQSRTAQNLGEGNEQI